MNTKRKIYMNAVHLKSINVIYQLYISIIQALSKQYIELKVAQFAKSRYSNK